MIVLSFLLMISFFKLKFIAEEVMFCFFDTLFILISQLANIILPFNVPNITAKTIYPDFI